MANENSSQIDRASYEKNWANFSANNTLSSENLSLWTALHASRRHYVGIGRLLFIWRFDGTAPEPLDVLSLESASLNLDSGLSLHFKDSALKDVFVGHSPVRLKAHPVFLWIPYFLEVRWGPANYRNQKDKRYLTMPVCSKGQSNSVKSLTPTHTYVSTVAEFRSEWPRYKNLQFPT